MRYSRTVMAVAEFYTFAVDRVVPTVAVGFATWNAAESMAMVPRINATAAAIVLAAQLVDIRASIARQKSRE